MTDSLAFLDWTFQFWLDILDHATHFIQEGNVTTTALPMPTVIIADAAGVIRWIDAHGDYTTRTEPDQILQAITQTLG
jgi:hypothetical protein